MIPEDARCTCEIKSSIAMEKAAFKKKQNLSTIDWIFKIFRQEQAKCCIFERGFE
jgi:hypothetical protein